MGIDGERDQYKRRTIYTVGIDEERDQYTKSDQWRGEGLGDGLFTL